MQDEETPTPDTVSADDVARPVRRKDGRHARAYLLAGLALIDAPEPVMRAPGLGPAQTAPMTPQEREERKRARRASAPKRAQRLARKAQRRRK